MFNVCASCAVAIENDDFSAMDNETEAKVRVSIELMGFVSLSNHSFPGYFDCFACDEVCIGEGYKAKQI